jgi:hypothetical protein
MLLLASRSGAQDKKPKNDRDPWNGFGVGSWVIQMESMTRGDSKEVHREKQTRLEAKEPGKIALSVRKEGKTKGVFDGEEETHWHVPGYDPL